jgi:hypothetical protein
VDSTVERHLRVLGLGPDASKAEIRAKYLDLVRVWHPDRLGGDQGLRQRAEDELKRINEAYEELQRWHGLRKPRSPGRSQSETSPTAGPTEKRAPSDHANHSRRTDAQIRRGGAVVILVVGATIGTVLVERVSTYLTRKSTPLSDDSSRVASLPAIEPPDRQDGPPATSDGIPRTTNGDVDWDALAKEVGLPPPSSADHTKSKHRAGRWPSGAKEAYVDRCGRDLSSQGMPAALARSYCRCIADALESEFTREEFSSMMKAQPDPAGSDSDRRLYRALSGCAELLQPPKSQGQ